MLEIKHFFSFFSWVECDQFNLRNSGNGYENIGL